MPHLLTKVMPGLGHLAGYDRRFAFRDAMAGISVAAVAIPVGLAYAALMGLPPIVGLYASILPMAAYALFGPSRQLIVGPDAATCTVVAATLGQLALSGIEDRILAASAIAVLVGIICLIASFLRFGFIANFLSRPILTGYLAGVSITLAVGQLTRLTGIPIDGKGIMRPLLEVVRDIGQIHWLTVILGLGLFLALRLIKWLSPALPGPILALIVAIALSWLFDLPGRGVAVLGAIPSGLPSFALPMSSGEIGLMVLGALGAFVVSFSSGIITAESFAARRGEKVDPNRELVGFGAANITAGFFQGFCVTGADSRTAVSFSLGGSSPLVAIVAAVAIALVVSFFTEPLALLPQAALGAILVSAAVDLIDIAGFRRLGKINRPELIFALIATGGVIWFGVLQGVIVAMGVTLLALLRQAAKPRDGMLGRRPGGLEFVKLHHYPEAVPVPGILVYLFEGSILFFNATYFARRVRRALRATPDARWLVLDAEAMTHADIGAVDTLLELKAELDQRHIRLVLASGHGQFREILERSGFDDAIGRDWMFDTVRKAVEAIEQYDAGGKAAS